MSTVLCAAREWSNSVRTKSNKPQCPLTLPIGVMLDSDLSAETFLCASDPPYCNAMLSPMSTYMSINTRTIVDDGSSFACDRMPMTTSCCVMASTPALN